MSAGGHMKLLKPLSHKGMISLAEHPFRAAVLPLPWLKRLE